MVKANELRIGNCLRLSDNSTVKKEFWGTPKEVTIKDLDFISTYPDQQYLEPIPLTPEILEACGFELNLGCVNEYQISLEDGFWLSWNTKSETLWYSSVQRGFYKMLRHLKYLHELQNFYFLFTGSELTLKSLSPEKV